MVDPNIDLFRDPRAQDEGVMQKLIQQRRLKQIQDSWQQYPGRAPEGTGPTGLAPNDAKGWSDIQNEQVEAMRLQGKNPEIRRGRDLGGMPPSIADDPTSTFNTQEGPYGHFASSNPQVTRINALLDAFKDTKDEDITKIKGSDKNDLELLQQARANQRWYR